MSSQPSLFGARTRRRLPNVKGLEYRRGFLTEEECDNLLATIDKQEREWLRELKRRVQHYGWKYDYRSRVVTEDMRIGDLPPFIRDVADRLHANGWFDVVPDQVIVNEYEPGQGIAAHVDRGCFGPTVATLSLGDAWPMEFAPYRPRRGSGTASEGKPELVLEVGSILVLTGDARWNWTHRIAARTKDGPRSRQKRVSVTFRAVVRAAPGRRASVDATRSVPGSRV